MTPFIRKKGALLIKDHIVPIIIDWLTKELGKVIKGKEGFVSDLKSISYIIDFLINEADKKF